MGEVYEVKQGDYLSKIAKDHGFSDWRTIYDDLQNTDFRKLRPNPNVICPGDRVYIPDRKVKTVVVRTGVTHKFVIKTARAGISILLKDINGEPVAIKKYELTCGSETFIRIHNQSRTQPNFDPANLSRGVVRELFRSPPTEGVLKVWLADESASTPDYQCIVNVGHLDPVTEVKGIQARLSNLGFLCGKVDGQLGPKTQQALRAFQQRHGLDVTGNPDAATQSQIEKAHGA